LHDISELFIGDYIYNYLDGYEYAKKIVDFDYEHNLILLDGIYEGSNLVGRLVKLNVFHDSLVIRNNIFRVSDTTPQLYQDSERGYIERGFVEPEYIEGCSDYSLQKQIKNSFEDLVITESFEIIEEEINA